MGFIDSIIVLFFLGWISSFLYRKYLRKRNKDWLAFLAIIFIGGFLIVDFLIYLGFINILWLNNLPWINIPVSSESGIYFMWNSFLIIGIDYNIIPVPGLNSIAILIFLSYPLWFNLGRKLGRLLHGYYTHEEGLLWMLKSGKKHYD
jgi:hypothetical protein